MIKYILTLILILLSTEANAVILFQENYEGTQTQINSNWQSSSCAGNFFNSSLNPAVSSTRAFNGTKSLKHVFTGHQIGHINAGFINGPLGSNLGGGCFTDAVWANKVSEAWYTWYEYWDAGFIVDELSTKLIKPGDENKGSHWWGTQGGPYTVGAFPNIQNGCCSPLIGRHVEFACQDCKTWSNTTLGDTWPAGNTKVYTENTGSFTIPDDKWVCHEGHLKYNTPGVADGIVEYFLTNMTDGLPTVQTLGYYNQEIRGARTTDPLPSDAGFNLVREYVQDGLGTIYRDGLTVSTTRVGCSGTPPPPDTTNPPDVSLPTGTPTSSTSITWTWPIVTDASGIQNYIVELCQGDGCGNFVQVGTPTTNSLVTNNLLPNTKYYLRVKAKDGVNLLSTNWSVTGSATTLTPTSSVSEYYVATNGSDLNPGTLVLPFLTLDKARQTVASVSSSMTGDITVYVRGGTYTLTSPLQFSSTDSGKNGFNIIYKAYGSEKPVFSGGRTITGWTNTGNNIWKASASGTRFRQMYVNEVRAQKARYFPTNTYPAINQWVGPNWTNPNNNEDGLQRYLKVNACDFPSCSLPSWTNLSKVEVVLGLEWESSLVHISAMSNLGGGVFRIDFPSIEKRNLFATFCELRFPNDQGCINGSASTSNHYYLQNALEFIDTPGEFYLNETTMDLYYMPRVGENLATSTVTVPTIDTLLRIVGTSSNRVTNIKFSGLKFIYSNWLYPTDNGMVTGQGSSVIDGQQVTLTTSGSGATPGMIFLEYVDNISFDSTVIKHGGASLVSIENGSKNTSFIGNSLSSAASSAIIIGVNRGEDTSNQEVIIRNINLKNNYIHDVGYEYHHGQGIQAHYTSLINIDHNEVFDIAYTGIGSDPREVDANPASINITNNLVYNTNTMTADGGGIYTFFKYQRVSTQTSTITGNFVHDIIRGTFGGGYPIAALYLDQCTDYTTATNNVFRNSAIITNLNFNGNPSCSLHNSVGSNPTSNTSIEANAGIEPAYAYVKTLDTISSPPSDTIAPVKPTGLFVE